MKERAFNARPDEVRAILAGATVLRRLLRVQPDFSQVWYPPLRSRRIRGYFSATHFQRSVVADCAPWKPGDRLWIREAWAGGTQLCAYKADGAAGAWMPDGNGGRNWWPHERLFEGAKSGFLLRKEYGDRWRSASAMPRWASRLILEVAGVEVERGPEGWAWVVTFRRLSEVTDG